MNKRLAALTDNIQFLVAEVEGQFGLLHRCLSKPAESTAQRILDRSGYAANLKMRIQSSALSYLAEADASEVDQRRVEAVNVVAAQLERMTEKCRDCARAITQVDEPAPIELRQLRPILSRVQAGALSLGPALVSHDGDAAMEIGQSVSKIEKSCDRVTNNYLKSIKKSPYAKDIAQALFIVQGLRQMGDALLRGSEAILSSNLRQPISFERYQSLQELTQGLRGAPNSLSIEPLAQTRSGSTIAGIVKDKPGAYAAVYKDGQRGKVKEERQGVESWQKIYPGLAPKILDYRKRGESAALLIEHLPGMTLEQVLLDADEELRKRALQALAKTLRSVWKETRSQQPVSAGFMQQLEKRLPEVYRIHPEFRAGKANIGRLRLRALETLIRQAKTVERAAVAPFSVYIHGDFNIDNIIYDPLEERINFIDVHRSRHMDYVQDVSVFMVSIYRLQILDAPVRRQLMKAALSFYQTAARFASRQQDATFELRLALGLARSFCSSTRFILDKSMARRMLLRSRYLLELTNSVSDPNNPDFRLPLKEIFVD